MPTNSATQVLALIHGLADAARTARQHTALEQEVFEDFISQVEQAQADLVNAQKLHAEEARKAASMTERDKRERAADLWADQTAEWRREGRMERCEECEQHTRNVSALAAE